MPIRKLRMSDWQTLNPRQLWDLLHSLDSVEISCRPLENRQSEAQRKPVEEDLAGYLDSTLLNPEAGERQIEKLCSDARQYKFHAVCINPVWVELAHHYLAEEPVSVCSVVAFPLGAQLTSVKVYETEQVLRKGATEVDVVMNIGAARSGQWGVVKADLEAVAGLCRSYNASCKVILEMCLLSKDEKKKAAEAAISAGVDYLKTSTGFSLGGATVPDVSWLKEWGGEKVLIKAAGGIKTSIDAWKMIEAGASRIGTSRAVELVTMSE